MHSQISFDSFNLMSQPKISMKSYLRCSRLLYRSGNLNVNLTAESHVRATRAGLNWMKLPPHDLNHFSKADFYNFIDDRKSTGNPDGMGGMTQRHCRRI